MVGWAGGDALGRLLLLSAATVVFSRLIDAEDFGISAIVLAIAAAAGLLVGAPFEEALVQRRVLRGAHLRSVMAFSMGVAVLLCLASLAIGPLLASAYDIGAMATLLPVAMLSVIFSGHGDLVTALARRRRRFNDIAAASLLGHAAGVPLAIAAALMGAGVWSLIVMRIAIVAIRSVVLQTRLHYPLRPRFSWPHLAQLGRFAGISFVDRLADNLTYLAFNNVVGLYFGLGVLGHVNMAMRLVEPIRGAVIATSHNLVFPHFRSIALASGFDAQARDRPIALLAFITAPVFTGLAAIMPLLLPLVAGPGWEIAVEIAICLSLGAAILMPARMIFTSLSAGGEPKYSLAGSLTGLAVTFALLVALRDAPPVAVGLARLAGDTAQMALAILVPAGFAHWTRYGRLRLLAPAWILSALMGLAVALVAHILAPWGTVTALVLSIATGIAVQIGLMIAFSRAAFSELLGIVRPQTMRQP